MHIYTVLDTTGDAQVALRDEMGGYHMARLHADIPPRGTRLQGTPAMPGFCLLLSMEQDGKVYRVTFELVGCSQEQLLSLIHPETTVPGYFSPEEGRLRADPASAKRPTCDLPLTSDIKPHRTAGGSARS